MCSKTTCITLLALVIVFGVLKYHGRFANVALGIRGELDGTTWWSIQLGYWLSLTLSLRLRVMCYALPEIRPSPTAKAGNSLKVLKELGQEFADGD